MDDSTQGEQLSGWVSMLGSSVFFHDVLHKQHGEGARRGSVNPLARRCNGSWCNAKQPRLWPMRGACVGSKAQAIIKPAARQAAGGLRHGANASCAISSPGGPLSRASREESLAW